jgi:hypothetical protein
MAEAVEQERAFTIEQVRVEPKCKVCRSEVQSSVDNWIGKRKARHRIAGPDSERVSWKTVEKMTGVLMPEGTPSITAIRRHASSHIRVVVEGVEEPTDKGPTIAAEAKAERESLVQAILARVQEGDPISSDEALDFVVQLGVSELATKVADGRQTVSLEQLLKAIDSKTRRKSNESEDALLQAITGGIGAAFSGALRSQPGYKELPQADVDGEAVEVEAEMVEAGEVESSSSPGEDRSEEAA